MQVRVLEGKHRGESLWTLKGGVVPKEDYLKLRGVPQLTAQAPSNNDGTAQKPLDHERHPTDSENAQANSLISRAKALEKINKKASLEYYNQVIMDYPKSDEAKQAKRRVKVLEKK